jgi:O-antigen/teichoic acid export membrane protein
MTTVCGLGFLAIVVLLSHFILPPAIPLRLVVAVTSADLIGQNIALTAGQAFQAYEQLHWTAGITAGLSVSRLVAVVSLLAIQRHPTALDWGYAYCISTAIVMAIALYLVADRLGSPRLSLYRSFHDIREGFYFSASLSAQTIYTDIDKTMLAKLDTLAATGIYGAATRILDASFAPVSALLYAAYPGFFRAGKDGIRSAFTYARPLLKRALLFSGLLSAAMLLLAPLVPYVLGPQYGETVVALRWLSPVPVLRAAHYFLSDTLTGSGHQGLRTALQVGIAAFSVIINLWLIPAYSWRGAAWSLIASNALLVCAVAIALLVLSRRPALTPEPVSL